MCMREECVEGDCIEKWCVQGDCIEGRCVQGRGIVYRGSVYRCSVYGGMCKCSLLGLPFAFSKSKKVRTQKEMNNDRTALRACVHVIDSYCIFGLIKKKHFSNYFSM